MKKILMIGAGYLQSFVIQKAKEMGYKVLAVDKNVDAVGFQYADGHKAINIVDKKACFEYAQQEQIDGVLTAATDYGVLTTAYIAEKMNLPGISYKTARLVKNKYQVRKCLYENHVDDTQQVYEISSEADADLVREKLVYPVMVKPCDGSGSRGASRVDDPKMFWRACQKAIEASIIRKAEVEPFISGTEYGVESLVDHNEVHVLAVMKKWMTKPPYYAELGHAVPSGLAYTVEKKVCECAKQAIQVLGINSGSVNMDVLVTEEGKVHIIDIGARMGGNMIGPCVVPYGTGIDYMENMIKIAANDSTDWTVKPHGAVATKLLAFQGGVVKKMPNFQKMMDQYKVDIYHHLQVNDVVREYHTNLDGCGYIIAKHDDSIEAEKIAAKVLQQIEEELFE